MGGGLPGRFEPAAQPVPGPRQRGRPAPDLSGFSIGGLDPVTYWQTVVIQTTASVQPHKDLPQAAAYLEAVQLAATYGSAVGDLQMKLLELYTQGMTAFDQLVAACARARRAGPSCRTA